MRGPVQQTDPGGSLIGERSRSRATIPLQLLGCLQGQQVAAVGVVRRRGQPA